MENQVRKFSIEPTPTNKIGTYDFEYGKKYRFQSYINFIPSDGVKEKISKKGNRYYLVYFEVLLKNDTRVKMFCSMLLFDSDKWFVDALRNGDIKQHDAVEVEGTFVNTEYSLQTEHLKTDALLFHADDHYEPLPDNSSETGRFELNVKSKKSPEGMIDWMSHEFSSDVLAVGGSSGAVISDINQVRNLLDFTNTITNSNHMKAGNGMELSLFDQPVFVHNPNDTKLDDINTIVAFDTETTGLGSLFHEIIQMSAVKLKKVTNKIEIKRRGKGTGKFKEEVTWQKVDEMDFIVHTDKFIQPFITNLTGITSEEVQQSKISQMDAVQRLIKFADDADAYVGQNITFDINMIKGITGIKLHKPVFDTMTIARNTFKNKRSYNLTNLAKLTKVKLERAHNALYDAEATGYVFVNLMNEFRNQHPEVTNVQEVADLEPLNYHAEQEVPFTKNIQMIARTYTGLSTMFAILSNANIHYHYKHPKYPIAKFIEDSKHIRDNVIVSNGGLDSHLLETLIMEGYQPALDESKRFNFDFIQLPNPEAMGYRVMDPSESIRKIKEEGQSVIDSLGSCERLDEVKLQKYRLRKFIKLEFRQTEEFTNEVEPGDSTIPVDFDGRQKAIQEVQEFMDNAIHDRWREVKESRQDYQILYDDMKKIAQELNVPFVIVDDARYTYDEVWLPAKIFARLPENKRASLWNADQLMKMMEPFDTKDGLQKCIIDDTLVVRDWIADDAHYIVKDLDTPHIEDGDKILRVTAYKRAHELYGKKLPKLIEDRIEKELKLIVKYGFESIYLIAAKLVNYTNNELGAIAGSRGSVGSSFVAYLVGITEVNALPPHYRSEDGEYVEFPEFHESGCDMGNKMDPRPGHEDEKLIKDGHDLVFEIFAGIDGDKVPDIDLNFDPESQVKAWEWVRNYFGRDRVFRVGTTSTHTLADALKNIRIFLNKHPNYKDVNDLRYSGLEGENHYRTNGKHAGGVYITPNDKTIFDYTPVQFPAGKEVNGWMTTSLDKDTLHDSLLKMDILGHEDELMLKIMYKRAGMTFDDLKKIPLDDKLVAQYFDGVNNIGLPELGTDNLSNIIKITKPRNFSDLVQIEGLAHSSTSWGDARPRIENGTVTIRDVIGTRDKVFRDLTSRGMGLREANKFVDAIKKKKTFTAEMFKELRSLKGLPDWYEASMVAQSYMYPGAHAVAYAMSAWRIAWFKAHHPLLFYRTWFEIRGAVSPELAEDMLKNDENYLYQKLLPLNGKTNSKVARYGYNGDPRGGAYYAARIAKEALQRVHSVDPNFQLFHDVDFEISKAHEYVEKDAQIYLPFDTLDNISVNQANNLEKLRDQNNGILNEEIVLSSSKRSLPSKSQQAIVAKMRGQQNA